MASNDEGGDEDVADSEASPSVVDAAKLLGEADVDE